MNSFVPIASRVEMLDQDNAKSAKLPAMKLDRLGTRSSTTYRNSHQKVPSYKVQLRKCTAASSARQMSLEIHPKGLSSSMEYPRELTMAELITW
tara:strand:- start:230 stop:511 length:282 start_codon:yes stop_codon:yes gene_type:complete